MKYQLIATGVSDTELYARVSLYEDFPTHREFVKSLDFTITTNTPATTEEIPALVHQKLLEIGYNVDPA